MATQLVICKSCKDHFPVDASLDADKLADITCPLCGRKGAQKPLGEA